jgi:hypothetical protein
MSVLDLAWLLVKKIRTSEKAQLLHLQEYHTTIERERDWGGGGGGGPVGSRVPQANCAIL